MRNMFKNNKAITLIALIITIVILIILAGVVISLSLGNNGLFNKAQEAKEKYTNAQDYEETEIAKMTNQIQGYVDGDRGNQTNTTQTITTTNGKYIFTKIGNIVYVNFTDCVEIYPYFDTTHGILLDSLPYALDTSKYPLVTYAGSDENDAENISFVCAVYAKNLQDSSTFVRVLPNGNLQVFGTHFERHDTNRHIAGSFQYFTTD